MNTRTDQILTNRELNRALLARQSLLSRRRIPARAPREDRVRQVIGMVDGLVGLQAQSPTPPYFAMWSRLAGFRPEDLAQPLIDRQVVRIVVMRGTVHLVSAADCRPLRELTKPVLARELSSNRQYAADLEGVDLDKLAKLGRELLTETPSTLAELAPRLAPHWPDREAKSLAHAIRNLVPLVQLPPRGVWGSSGQPVCTPADAWLGPESAGSPLTIDEMVLRYLAAFGPATVADVRVWSGLTGLNDVLDRLRDRLLTFRDERGRELFDLPDAPRPPAGRGAPPRFLPEFDNVLLSHADRSRIVPEAARARLISKNGVVPGTVLINGYVGASWRIGRTRGSATLTVTPFAPLSASTRDAVEAEGIRLLAFAEPDAAADVRVLKAD